MAQESPNDPRLDVLRDFAARSSNLAPQAILDLAAVDLLRGMATRGVDAFLLKGPVLEEELYRPGARRGYLDIDILVGPDDLVAARATLRDLDYRRDPPGRTGVDDFLGVLHAEVWSNRDGCAVDLHWRLPGCALEPAQAWTILDSSRRTMKLRDFDVGVLGSDALAMHVALHAAQSGPRDVKAMGDLERAIDRWPLDVWRRAAVLAAELSATDAFSAGMHLQPKGAALARQLSLPHSPSLLWAIENRDTRPRGTFHFAALAESKSWRDRVQILRKSIAPRPEWIAAQFPWVQKGGRTALVAGYALHIARAPLWATRAWMFNRRARGAAEASRQVD